MVQNLLAVWPLIRVLLQSHPHKVLGILTNVGPFVTAEIGLALLDCFLKLLDILAVKGHLTREEDINNYGCAPNIDLTIIGVINQHLRCHAIIPTNFTFHASIGS